MHKFFEYVDIFLYEFIQNLRIHLSTYTELG